MSAQIRTIRVDTISSLAINTWVKQRQRPLRWNPREKGKSAVAIAIEPLEQRSSSNATRDVTRVSNRKKTANHRHSIPSARLDESQVVEETTPPRVKRNAYTRHNWVTLGPSPAFSLRLTWPDFTHRLARCTTPFHLYLYSTFRIQVFVFEITRLFDIWSRVAFEGTIELIEHACLGDFNLRTLDCFIPRCCYSFLVKFTDAIGNYRR